MLAHPLQAHFTRPAFHTLIGDDPIRISQHLWLNDFSALTDAVGWMVEGHPTCKKLSGEVLVLVSV